MPTTEIGREALEHFLELRGWRRWTTGTHQDWLWRKTYGSRWVTLAEAIILEAGFGDTFLEEEEE